MVEPAPPILNGTKGGIAGIAQMVVQALSPPTLLLIALLNLAMMWMVLKNLEMQADQRFEIIRDVVGKCLGRPSQ